MQVALISDIHGNAVALDAVLEEIEQEDPDQIVCLGDIAAPGPQPIAVIERIQQLDCPVIMGNTEEQLLSRELPDDHKDLPQWAIDLQSGPKINFSRNMNRGSSPSKIPLCWTSAIR